jgi:hypothetical protein
MAALKAQGLTEQSSPELGQLGQIIKLFQKLSDWNKVAAQAKQRQMQQQQQQQQAGRGAGGAHSAFDVCRAEVRVRSVSVADPRSIT